MRPARLQLAQEKLEGQKALERELGSAQLAQCSRTPPPRQACGHPAQEAAAGPSPIPGNLVTARPGSSARSPLAGWEPRVLAHLSLASHVPSRPRFLMATETESTCSAGCYKHQVKEVCGNTITSDPSRPSPTPAPTLWSSVPGEGTEVRSNAEGQPILPQKDRWKGKVPS